MKLIRTSIIPDKQVFINTSGSKELNLKAICIFACTGFFLGEDTYFKDLLALQPYTEYELDEKSSLVKSKKYWNWHYSPREISLKQSTEEFAHLFETLTRKALTGKKVILPLSGGLDSRTQAAALGKEYDVKTYSYKFENSFDETKYGKEISDVQGFQFQEYVIRSGYLWNVIDKLSEINGCYADFTHPRQMAVIEEVKKLGNVFYLGHWGDVLFDDSSLSGETQFDDLVCKVRKKIVKKGGQELARSLWNAWGIEGSFDDYITDRIFALLKDLEIENPDSRVRAFKSTYWAPRWTSANLNVFGFYADMFIPYYSDEMCKFICTIPEEHLSGRKIQIEYIKMKNSSLAKIPWQNYDPLNLYDYEKFRSRSMLARRAFRKTKRMFDENVLGKKRITRNWENQFVGSSNEVHLRKYLFENAKFSELIPAEIVSEFYGKFRNEDALYYSHPVSMLLTLSLFCNLK